MIALGDPLYELELDTLSAKVYTALSRETSSQLNLFIYGRLRLDSPVEWFDRYPQDILSWLRHMEKEPYSVNLNHVHGYLIEFQTEANKICQDAGHKNYAGTDVIHSLRMHARSDDLQLLADMMSVFQDVNHLVMGNTRKAIYG